MERDKRERGELVIAVGPFCVPCGKRFAKQTVYDAHLSGKKHLAALQRMGKHEEAMVCQLDVEAKRRKLAEVEEARHALTRPRAETAAQAAERAESEAQRIAVREAKLRERALLPMPKCVAATTVYREGDDDGDGGDGSDGPPMAGGASDGGSASASASAPPTGAAATAAAVVVPEVPASASVSTLASVGAGSQGFSYTSGLQDGSGATYTNRHTTPGMAASHRALAQPSADWFNPGGAAAR